MYFDVETELLAKVFFSYFIAHALLTIFMKLLEGSNWYYKVYRYYLVPFIFRQLLFAFSFSWFIGCYENIFLQVILLILWLVSLLLLINMHMKEISIIIDNELIEKMVVYSNLGYLFFRIFNKKTAEEFRKDILTNYEKIKRIIPQISSGARLGNLMLHSIVFCLLFLLLMSFPLS